MVGSHGQGVEWWVVREGVEAVRTFSKQGGGSQFFFDFVRPSIMNDPLQVIIACEEYVFQLFGHL